MTLRDIKKRFFRSDRMTKSSQILVIYFENLKENIQDNYKILSDLNNLLRHGLIVNV